MMGFGDWIALGAALTLGVLAALRTSAALAGRNRALWIAHIIMAVCLALKVSPVYFFVDGVLGGTNLAHLLSHLLFAFVFHFGCQHVAIGVDRPDLAALIAGKKSWLVLVVLSALIAAAFFISDLPVSSAGLVAFDGEGPVAAYKSLSYTYPMLCCLVLLKPLYREANSYDAPLSQRIAMWFLCLGFLLVIPVPFIHAASHWDPALSQWVDLTLYSAILLVAMGPMIAFLEARRYTASKTNVRAR